MSDQAYFTATTSDKTLTGLRDNVEASLGASRLKTVVRYTSGPQTLAGDADVVTCSGTFTVNLPAAPLDGDAYEFWQEASAETLTIGRNGKTINGASSDVTIASQWGTKTLTWSASADTWLQK